MGRIRDPRRPRRRLKEVRVVEARDHPRPETEGDRSERGPVAAARKAAEEEVRAERGEEPVKRRARGEDADVAEDEDERV
jgi:hypothetical protein